MFDDGVATGEDVFGRPLPPGAGRPATEAAAPGPDPAAELSLPVQQLLASLPAVVGQVPAELPGSQALADTAALLRAIEQLHAAVLGRVADVDARKLHTLVGASSAGSWVAQQQTSLDRGELALARRLAGLPTLDTAVREGRLSVATAERVAKALAKLRRHVDRPDGLIDGQPAEQVLVGVIGHGVKDLICQHLGGLADDDPRLAVLLEALAQIVESPTGELARLEAAFVLLAEHLEPALLPDALGTLVDACLPNELEKRAADAHSNRGFGVRRNGDGSGFHVTDGDLDLETGELLWTVLQAGLTADPDNPVDTAEFAGLREQGWQAGDPLPATGGPRSRRQRGHDALRLALRALLDSGALGSRDKAAPHVAVTTGLDTLHRVPGAMPAVAASGTRLPSSLVRRWFCESAVTRFVLSLGRKVIETSHPERTLTAQERRIKKIETGGRCQIAGCRCGPSARLVPHHGDPWAQCHTTSLTDAVLICEPSHHDLHSGGHTLRLKDGRWLNEHGWADGPGR